MYYCTTLVSFLHPAFDCAGSCESIKRDPKNSLWGPSMFLGHNLVLKRCHQTTMRLSVVPSSLHFLVSCHRVHVIFPQIIPSSPGRRRTPLRMQFLCTAIRQILRPAGQVGLTAWRMLNRVWRQRGTHAAHPGTQDRGRQAHLPTLGVSRATPNAVLPS